MRTARDSRGKLISRDTIGLIELHLRMFFSNCIFLLQKKSIYNQYKIFKGHMYISHKLYAMTLQL